MAASSGEKARTPCITSRTVPLRDRSGVPVAGGPVLQLGRYQRIIASLLTLRVANRSELTESIARSRQRIVCVGRSGLQNPLAHGLSADSEPEECGPANPIMT